MLGVLNVVPDPKELPPEDAANQLMVPAETAAPSETIPAPHLEPGVVLVTLGIAFTVANTGVLAPVAQPFTLKASA